MKFIIFSDIHGNVLALKECIKEIEKIKIDGIIWCGDYVTDFPWSHEVIQIIKEYSKKIKSYIISGNREQNIIDFDKDKKCNIRQKSNLEYTYKLLDENDIEWIKSLPDSIKIELDNGEYIYVSHKCTYEKVDNCKYKIFGHSHRQCNFIRDGVKYINPGAVGIPVDGNVGAEFAILEITEGYEKLEEYIVKYNIESLIESLKNTVIYNDEVKWGMLLEKELKTGKDVFFECIEEYNKIREEHKILEENLEVWNLAVKNVLSK